MTDPIDVVRSECNDDDVIRAVIPTERDGDTLFVVVVREQPSDRFGTAVHVRTLEVDLGAGQGHWTPNGAVFPADSMDAILPGLTVAKNALGDESGTYDDPLIKNGIGAGGDDLARSLLGIDTDDGTDDGTDDRPDRADAQDDRDDDRPDEGEQSTLVEKGDVEPSERVTCDKCGREIARENAENFGGFGIGTDVFVCAEGCPDE